MIRAIKIAFCAALVFANVEGKNTASAALFGKYNDKPSLLSAEFGVPDSSWIEYSFGTSSGDLQFVDTPDFMSLRDYDAVSLSDSLSFDGLTNCDDCGFPGFSGSASLNADLNEGALRARATGFGGGLASARVRIRDRIELLQENVSGINISISAPFSGRISAKDNNEFSVSASGEIMASLVPGDPLIFVAPPNGREFLFRSSDGIYAETLRTDFWLPANQNYFYMRGELFVQAFASRFAGHPADADFSNTLRINIELPSGFSFLSESGGTYSGESTVQPLAPIPLPAAAWFLLTALGGLFGLRWLKRSRPMGGHLELPVAAA